MRARWSYKLRHMLFIRKQFYHWYHKWSKLHIYTSIFSQNRNHIQITIANELEMYFFSKKNGKLIYIKKDYLLLSMLLSMSIRPIWFNSNLMYKYDDIKSRSISQLFFHWKRHCMCVVFRQIKGLRHGLRTEYSTNKAATLKILVRWLYVQTHTHAQCTVPFC